MVEVIPRRCNAPFVRPGASKDKAKGRCAGGWLRTRAPEKALLQQECAAVLAELNSSCCSQGQDGCLKKWLSLGAVAGGVLYPTARCTTSVTSMARHKLISSFSSKVAPFASFFPSLTPPRNAIKFRPGRTQQGLMDGCLAFVKHGLHMVLWTWPSRCGVHQLGGQGHPKRRCQF